MFTKDNFLHSTFAKITGKEGRIAILKTDIVRYEEHGINGPTEITVKGIKGYEGAIITMSYDDVKNSLTEQIC